MKYEVFAIRRYTHGTAGVDVAPRDTQRKSFDTLKEARAFRPFGRAGATKTIEVTYDIEDIPAEETEDPELYYDKTER